MSINHRKRTTLFYCIINMSASALIKLYSFLFDDIIYFDFYSLNDTILLHKKDKNKCQTHSMSRAIDKHCDKFEAIITVLYTYVIFLQ